MKGLFALVTGASSGIGFSIAERFIQAGASVGVHYCSDIANAEKLVALGEKGQCKIFQADFKKSEDVLKFFDSFFQWAGTIDILVNNAGIIESPAPITDLTEDAWDKTYQVNVKSPFLLCRESFKIMKSKKSGNIINISSIGVKYGGGQRSAHYSSSKAALEALTRSLAKSGAPFNILVNALRAGVTDTNFHKKIGLNDMTDRVALIPLKRMATVEEIAESVYFLASPKNTYMTGITLPVSGGE